VSSASFTIIGSSSGVPQARRACSGYVLDTSGSLSLFDSGGGVCSSYLTSGFDPLDLDRIFISHTHPDHCCELPLVIQMVYLAGRKEKLEIFVPEEFVEPFKAYLNAVYIIPEKLPFELRLIGYSDDFRFSNGFELEAIANTHLGGYAEYIKRLGLPNRMQSYSFQLSVGEKRLFFSGDIAGLSDVKDYLDNNDFVVIESTHIDLEEFFSFTSTAKVGQFILTHLGSTTEIEQTIWQAEKAGVTNIKVASDGMILELC